MIGQLLASVVAPVSDVAKQYIAGKNKIAGAKVDFEVAKFAARAKRLDTEQGQNYDLDKLAVKEAAKTCWDEAICLLPLSYLAYSLIWGVYGYANGWRSPMEVSSGLGEHGHYFLMVLIGLVYIRYLGFRGFALKGFKLWKSRHGSVVDKNL